MRIGFEYMLTGTAPTGVGVAVREMLAALLRRLPPKCMTIYTNASCLATLPEGAAEQEVAVSSLAGAGRLGRIVWQQMALPMSMRRQLPDVYHATGYVASPNLGSPTVLTVYDTIALDTPTLTTRSNFLHYRLALRRSVRASARVVVPCRYVRERLLAFVNIEPSRIHVIPLGVSSGFCPLASESVPSGFGDLGLPNSARYVLCVGRMEKKKNLGLAIEALARLRANGYPDLLLVLAGAQGNDVAHLQRLIQRLNLERAVIRTGYIDDDTLLALYQRAVAVLYPSLNEGFGFPPLEAMACGTPTLVSSCGALREICGNAAMLLEPDDISAWAKMLDNLLSQPKFRTDLIARGLRHAARFTWDRHAEALLTTYEQALARQPTASVRNVDQRGAS